MPQFPYPAPQQQWAPPNYQQPPNGQPTYQGQPPMGQPYQPSAPPQTGFGADGGQYNGGSMPQQNVFLPQAGSDTYFGEHPGLARGIDSAMATVAAMQTGPTIGSNISGVANALLNTPHFKQQLLMQRASAPMQMQSMQNNLDLQRAQVEHFSALGQELRDRGQYYLNGGRPQQSQYKADDDGNLWMLHGSDPATPVVDAEGNHIQARAPQQRTPQGTEAERQVNNENTDRQARGLPAYTATERGRRLTQIHAANAGAAAGAGANAKNNTPGNVPQTTELQYKNLSAQISEAEKNLSTLDKMKNSQIDEQFSGTNPDGSKRSFNDKVAARNAAKTQLQQQHDALTKQRNALVGGGGRNVPPTPNVSSGQGQVPPTPAGKKTPQVRIAPDGSITIQ